MIKANNKKDLNLQSAKVMQVTLCFPEL